MSSSTKIDNKKKNVLILGKSPTQGFCFSVHYNKENSYLFVNGSELIKF